MRQLIISASTAAALLGVSAPATAGQVTIQVSADGLDLARAADIAAMKERIDVAVSKACARPTAAGRYGTEAVEECVADGTAKALAALDAKLAHD